MRKLLLFISLLFGVLQISAQNNQLLYGFDQLPQTLMLNPGAEVDYQKHFGIPLLSNIFMQVGASNSKINYNNIVAGSNRTLDIARNIYAQDLSSKDFFNLYQRLEVVNVGYRLNNPKLYLSFGMYQELDGFAKYPKELTALFFEGDDRNGDGIPETNLPVNLNQLNIVGDLNGVYHVGISGQINEKLTLGARFKIISAALSINSKNNDGVYHLENNNLIYNHVFEQMNSKVNAAGIWNSQGYRIFDSDNPSSVFPSLFFGQENFGVGLDLGLTYHFNNEVTLTASVLDLDYINYQENIKTYQVKEDFVLPDADYFEPTPGDEFDYWESTLDRYYNASMIPIDTLRTSYSTFRSPKVNASLAYKIYHGGKTKSVFRNLWCEPEDYQEVLTSEIGIQTYTAFRPNKMVWAVTGFYSREITKNLNTKVTYTIDEFSKKNIGLGVSTNIRRFNLFLSADNLLDLFQIKQSNYQSIQMGMNFIFK